MIGKLQNFSSYLSSALLIGVTAMGCDSSFDDSQNQVEFTSLSRGLDADTESVSCDRLKGPGATMNLPQALRALDYFPQSTSDDSLVPSLSEYEAAYVEETGKQTETRTQHPVLDCEKVRLQSVDDSLGRATLIVDSCNNLNEYRQTSRTLIDSRTYANSSTRTTILKQYDGVLDQGEYSERRMVLDPDYDQSLFVEVTSTFDKDTPYYLSPEASAPVQGTHTVALLDTHNSEQALTVNFSEELSVGPDIACQFSQRAIMNVDEESISILDGNAEGRRRPILCDRIALEASAFQCVQDD